jgi:acetyltransferase-like isoleucine patch superfamily enzyme
LGEVKIGDHVMIGANTTVLPGVTIGDHAVIGAGSVVTKDVPPHAFAAGNPIRVIRVNEERQRDMKASQNRN